MCASGFYSAGGVTACAACTPNNCHTCSNTGAACLTCKSGYGLLAGACVLCNSDWVNLTPLGTNSPCVPSTYYNRRNVTIGLSVGLILFVGN